MLGQTWKSEFREFKDEKTGRTIRQLTQQGNNYHIYFTENSFFKDSNQIVFRSDRASGEDKTPHKNPAYNLFSMDLDSGEICQLTKEVTRIGGVTKTVEGNLIVYVTGNKVRQLDMESREITAIYEETGSYNLGSPSISKNRQYIAFCRNEHVQAKSGPNYSGFADRY
jgi:oligogalacturonide lyase